MGSKSIFSGQTEVGAGPTPNGARKREFHPVKIREFGCDDEEISASPAEQSLQHTSGRSQRDHLYYCEAWWAHAPFNVDRPLREAVSRNRLASPSRGVCSGPTISDYRWTPPNRRTSARSLLAVGRAHGFGTIVIGVGYICASVAKKNFSNLPVKSRDFGRCFSRPIYVVYCDAAGIPCRNWTAEPITLSQKEAEATDFGGL